MKNRTNFYKYSAAKYDGKATLLKAKQRRMETILDPTMGSGSTGVACKNMNRNFIGIEMDDEIYEVAVNRIED